MKPENTKKVDRNIQSGTTKILQGSRNVTDFLPNIFKTPTNRKFLNSTLENLFSSGTTENINSYWGKVSGSTFDYENDVFNSDTTSIRQNYQFATGFKTSVDSQEVATSYINAIRSLTSNGYAVGDMDRLMAEQEYILDLPINSDMFVNYLNYHWLIDDMPVCVIEPTSSNPIDIDKIVKVNSYTTPVLENGKTLTLVNGMRISFSGVNATSSSGNYFANSIYFVEGVGSGEITLVEQIDRFGKNVFPRAVPYTPYIYRDGWDTSLFDSVEYDDSVYINLLKEYVVMDRMSDDKNAWSRINKWYSIYAITATAEYNEFSISSVINEKTSARRPIIQFDPNMELYNSGKKWKLVIDHHIEGVTEAEIEGNSQYFNNYYYLENGDRVLLTDKDTDTFGVYAVTGVGSNINLTSITSSLAFQKDDKIYVSHSNVDEFIANEFYYEFGKLIRAQQKTHRSDSPLFSLYDSGSKSLNNYNETNFVGNEIFKYKTSDTSILDQETGLNLAYDLNNPEAYSFDIAIESKKYLYSSENGIITNIDGEYFFKKHIHSEQYVSVWSPTKDVQRSKVNEVIVVEKDGQNVSYNISPIEHPNSYIVKINQDNAIWFEKKYGYIYSDGEKNPNITLVRNMDYTINYISNYQSATGIYLDIFDPYGNVPSGVTISNDNTNEIALNVSDSYEYDTLIYKASGYEYYGIIFLVDSIKSYDVLLNGNSATDTDYVYQNGTIKITSSLKKGDVVEFSYYTDQASAPRDIASSFKYNPLNEPVFELNSTEIADHIIKQNIENPFYDGVFVGENTYYKSPKNTTYGGNIRQQIYSPAPHSIFHANENYDILTSIDIIKTDYENFKNIFKSKVTQLWNRNSFDSIRDLVDETLSQINIGKNETFSYARSNMAYYDNFETYTHNVTDTDLTFDISFLKNAYGNKKTSYQLWIITDESTQQEWVPLKEDKDFTLNFDLIKINQEILGSATSATVELRLYDMEAKSYIPYSPVALGFAKKSLVRFDGNYIICHDGSKHTATTNEIFNMYDTSFDVVSAAVYDLETRIYNNISDSKTSVFEFLPRTNTREFMNYSLLNTMLKEECISWSSAYTDGYEEVRILDFNSADKFTYNYKSVTEYESYKSLYKYMFNTERPHTHPWEMFGFVDEPTWWSAAYSWVDVYKRERLVDSLKNGSINYIGNQTEPDIAYAYYNYDWDNQILVTETGELNDPITAGIIDEIELGISNLHNNFSFGNDMFLVEQNWKNTSDYIFSLAKALFRLKPYKMWNIFWKKNDLIELNQTSKSIKLYDSTKSRIGIREKNLHLYKNELKHVIGFKIPQTQTDYGQILSVIAPQNEFYGQATFSPVINQSRIENIQIINSGYGYRKDFPVIIQTVNGYNTSEVMAVVEDTPVNTVFGMNALLVEQYNNITNIEELLHNTESLPIIHLGGYSKKELLKIELDGSYTNGKITIPPEDYGIYLSKSPTIARIRYSGVIVKKTETGEYEVSGYNTRNKNFIIYQVNTNGQSNDVVIDQTYSITRYTKFKNLIAGVPYGTRFKKRQDLYNFLTGLEEFYKKIGFHDMNWEQGSLSIMRWTMAENDSNTTWENGLKNNRVIFKQGSTGIVKEISDYDSFNNPISNVLKSPISPNNFIFYRSENFTEIKPKNEANLTEKIYGITIDLIEYEHLLHINQQTRFGDIIQNNKTGLFNDRIKIKGERTKNWNGRINVPGFLVTESEIVNNFDSNIREIENDILNSYNKTLNTLTRYTDKYTVGYQEKPYFIDLTDTETSAYEFSKGVRKYKGTTQSIDAILKNKNIFANNSDTISEDWMIFSKDYGDKNVSDAIRVEVPRDLVKSDPQIIRFNNNTSYDDPYDTVIDIPKGSSSYISGNFENPIPTLPPKPFSLRNADDIKYFENFAKTSGIPFESEVDYVVGGIGDMLEVYEYSSDYANVPLWSGNVSYKKGDIVRKGPRVYQYLLETTGYNQIASQSYIRGNVTFPIVSSGSTFIIGVRQADETEITYYDITFEKTQGVAEYVPYEYISTVANPVTNVGKNLSINGNTIVLSSSTATNVTPTSNSITATGTLADFSVIGEYLDQIIIDDYRIRLSNIDELLNSKITLFTALSSVNVDLQNVGLDSAGLYLGNIPTKMNAFRQSYISETSLQDWKNFLNNYYSGIYENYGFNINYLTNFYSSLNGFEDYYDEFVAFYENEISIYETLFGITIENGVTQVSSTTLNTMIQSIENTLYITKISRYIKSGGIIIGSDNIAILGTTDSVSLDSQEIVDKINNYFSRLNLSDSYAANIIDDKLQIVKYIPLAQNTGSLSIIVDTTGTNLGFENEINVYNVLDELVTTEYFVSLENLINTINFYAINGIVASSQNGYLKITSSNPELIIGEGTANSDIGLVAGTYASQFVDGTILLDLDVNDVVEQINNENIQNVVASNINGSVVISASVAEIDIGAGTANSVLGFSDIDSIVTVGTNESAGSISNTFNSSEWTTISDPIDFNIWVNNNLDPIIVNTSRSSGYNVYQAMDFDLEIFEICPGTFSNDDAMIKFLKPHNLQVNDYVVITASNSSPNVDGIHRVTAIYSDTIIFIESYIKNNGSYGKCFPLRPVRFSNTQQMLDSGFDQKYHSGIYGWKPGMYAYVDSYEDTGIPAAYRCIDVNLFGAVYFELIRKFEPMADNYKLKSAYAYDYGKMQTKTEFEVFDPVKGIIPGIAEIEIDIKSIYDNARYTDSTDTDEKIDMDNYWADDHVGKTWWDMSTAVYMDYEQGSLDGRQQNWGKLYPTSSIDVYEWTKSTVPPDIYEEEVISNAVVGGIQLTGTPYYRIGRYGDKEYYWTEKTTFDRSRGINETYYYYWVKNKTTVPNSKRRYTTIDLENIIRNPSSYGINWIAAISNDAIILSGLADCLACDKSIINVWFQESDDSYHKEYIILSEEEKEKKIPYDLHKSLRDSLAGYTDYDIELTYSPWMPLKNYKKDDVVKYEDSYYIAMSNNTAVTPAPQISVNPVVYDGVWHELKFLNAIQNEDVWDIKSYGYTWDDALWDDTDWSRIFPDNLDNIDGELYIKSLKNIPDYKKHPLVKNGISKFGQSWFKNVSDARRSFVEKLNQTLKMINMYEIRSSWYYSFNTVFHPTGKVFDSSFVEYKVSDMYTYTDWYTADYKNITKINYTIQTAEEIGNINPSLGETLKIIGIKDPEDDIKRSKIYMYDGVAWNLIYHEKATIHFSDDIWNPKTSSRTWSDDLWDVDSWDRDTGPYFFKMLDILYETVFNGELKSLYNELWFTMLRYVHSEQDFVNWAVKSSYFKFVLENEFTEDKKYKKDIIQNVLDYIQDVKPFTSKMRDFTNRKNIIDSTTIGIAELDDIKSVTLNYSDVSTDAVYNGDVILTNTFAEQGDIDTVTSDMITTEYDFIYDGNVMDYSNDKFSEELIPSRMRDAVGIFITRNEVGDTETDTTKQYVMHVNNKNKISYSISENTDISQLTNNILKTDTSIEVDDGSKFLFNSGNTISKSSGVAWINGERIEYKNVIGNILLNCVRGTGGTAPRDHIAGDDMLYTNNENVDYPPIELSTILYDAINFN